MKIKQETPEVYYITDHYALLKKNNFDQLVNLAFKSKRKRARYCAHQNKESDLHDMFEVFTNQTYMHPLKQKHKNYSFHIIQGCVDVYLFSDEGDLINIISLGDFESGKAFYFMPPKNTYRMLVTKTEFVLYHEATIGPFQKEDTLFAPWAPTETDMDGIKVFFSQLKEQVEKITAV